MVPTGLAPWRPPAAALLFAWCGAAAFALSLLYFLYSYFVRFAAAAEGPDVIQPAAANVALFTVFALHHSVFARPAVKDRLRRIVPAALERSVYTWIASVLFVLVCALWQPVPGELYRLTGLAAAVGWAVQAAGLAITAKGSSRLGVLDLAGVAPVVSSRRSPAPGEPAHVPLETRGLYGFVRHPLYFAWALVVFGAPAMTMTRFVFAAVSTAYLAAAIPLEERGLARTFGADYAAYRARVRWRMLPGIY
jgi:protein-S-isoprenylcysteine O-methyltransferase Ste14